MAENTKSTASDSAPSIDKQKYLAIVRSEGLQQALTALHHDLERLEHQCFESPDGYHPEIWKQIEAYRTFSMELWDTRYGENQIA